MRREYVDTHLLTLLPGRAEFTAVGASKPPIARRRPCQLAAKREDLMFAGNHPRLAVDRGPSRHGARTQPAPLAWVSIKRTACPACSGLARFASPEAKSAQMAVTTINCGGRHDHVEHKACALRPWLPRVRRSGIESRQAPVAQLDRALPSEGKGQRFESPRARQQFQWVTVRR
jgi:hypothetical protein